MKAKQLREAFYKRGPVLRPVEVKGVGTVYLRDQTVGEINDSLDNARDRRLQMAREQSIPFDESDSDSVDAALAKVKDPHRIARAMAQRMCDESGERIFDPDNLEDLLVIEKLEESAFKKINERIEEDAAKN